MSTRMDRRAPATTFLVHFFGRGLVDEGRSYAVERFVSLSNGDIRRGPVDVPRSKKARSRPKPEVATFGDVRDMRPTYNELFVEINITMNSTSSGIQYWGPSVCGILGDRRQRP